jgi:hypothetical protein
VLHLDERRPLEADLDLGLRGRPCPCLSDGIALRLLPLDTVPLELFRFGSSPANSRWVVRRTKRLGAECAQVAPREDRLADLLTEADEQRIDRTPELDRKPVLEVAPAEVEDKP